MEGAQALAAMQSSLPPDEQRQLDTEGTSRQRRGHQQAGNTGDSEQQTGSSEEEERKLSTCFSFVQPN